MMLAPGIPLWLGPDLNRNPERPKTVRTTGLRGPASVLTSGHTSFKALQNQKPQDLELGAYRLGLRVGQLGLRPRASGLRLGC